MSKSLEMPVFRLDKFCFGTVTTPTRLTSLTSKCSAAALGGRTAGQSSLDRSLYLPASEERKFWKLPENLNKCHTNATWRINMIFLKCVNSLFCTFCNFFRKYGLHKFKCNWFFNGWIGTVWHSVVTVLIILIEILDFWCIF